MVKKDSDSHFLDTAKVRIKKDADIQSRWEMNNNKQKSQTLE